MLLIIFLILICVIAVIFNITNKQDLRRHKATDFSDKDSKLKQVISGNVSDISKLMFMTTMSIMENASGEIGGEFKNKSPNIYGTAAFIIYITNSILIKKNFSNVFVDIANNTFLQEYLKDYINENHIKDTLNLSVKIKAAIQELGSQVDIKSSPGTLRYCSLKLNYIYALNILDLVMKLKLTEADDNKLPSSSTNLKAFAYFTSIQLDLESDLDQILDLTSFKEYYSNIYSTNNKTNLKSNHKSIDKDILYPQRNDGYYIRYEDYATDDMSKYISNNHSTSTKRNNIANKVQLKSCSDESNDSKLPTISPSKQKTLRECKKCGTQYPLTKEYFGHTDVGNFRSVCRTCMKERTRQHSEQNPDAVKKRLEKRKKLERNSADIKDYDDQSLKLFLYQQQKTKCFYCRETMDKEKELDHMNPLSRGGLDIKDNIVLSCKDCNREKHHKTVEEYRIWKKKNGEKVLF